MWRESIASLVRKRHFRIPHAKMEWGRGIEPLCSLLNKGFTIKLSPAQKMTDVVILTPPSKNGRTTFRSPLVSLTSAPMVSSLLSA